MNTHAKDGLDRCQCGCKYWEHDRCIDCGTYIRAALVLDVKDAKEAYLRATVLTAQALGDELRQAQRRLDSLDNPAWKRVH